MGEALGLLETRGLAAMIQGADAMAKAANVDVLGWRMIGGGLVTGMIRGDVAAVTAATEAGAAAAAAAGELVCSYVIARPHESLHAVLPAVGNE